MTSFVSHTTVDCHDAFALSEWWRQVLGYVDDPSDPNEPGHEECPIHDPAGGEWPHTLLFIEVPDSELPAKRIHFDLRPSDRTQAEEIERLRGLGATVVADRRGRYGEGTGWVTFADPEGNQFCVLRSPAELAES